MGRGLGFTPAEDSFLLEHAETKTAKEVYDLHEGTRATAMWPKRSLKSLARRVERLREIGKLDVRTEEARRKAYYGRQTKNIRSEGLE